jgi:hypothetical protein
MTRSVWSPSLQNMKKPEVRKVLVSGVRLTVTVWAVLASPVRSSIAFPC